MSASQQSKLPLHLKHEFDQMILSRFREWEKIERKIAAFTNHLHFTLNCKHHGVFPASLTLKCSKRGAGTERILRRAQLALLNKRITRIKRELLFYKNVCSNVDEFLFLRLRGNWYEEVCQFMVHASKMSFDNNRERQKQKFQRILTKSQGSQTENSPIVDVEQKEKGALQSQRVWSRSDAGRNFASQARVEPRSDPILTACQWVCDRLWIGLQISRRTYQTGRNITIGLCKGPEACHPPQTQHHQEGKGGSSQPGHRQHHHHLTSWQDDDSGLSWTL